MKRAILIFALGRSSWIGGIYYRKNIVHMLLSNKNITSKYKILILTNTRFSDVFCSFHPQAKIILCGDKTGFFQAALRGLRCCLKYRIKYVFPIMPYKFLILLGITPVSWIADFQHCHYPEFFTTKEISTRNRKFSKIAEAKNPLIVSSNSALDDFKHFYTKERKNVHVIHFTSYIKDELEELSKSDEMGILSKLGLVKNQYIAVCNQFWKHKNHLTVLRAIQSLVKQYPRINLQIVFTGELSERRDPSYINEVKKMLNSPLVKEQVKVLGFIDRATQLCVMKHSRFIIQPSLFEGWGTVVEDAKVLRKKILLSDIKVHREQMDYNCRFFNPYSVEDLAEKILDMLNSPREYECEIDDRTEIYAKALESVFR